MAKEMDILYLYLMICVFYRNFILIYSQELTLMDLKEIETYILLFFNYLASLNSKKSFQNSI